MGNVVYSAHKEKNASIGIKHIISFQGRESGEISALSSFYYRDLISSGILEEDKKIVIPN